MDLLQSEGQENRVRTTETLTVAHASRDHRRLELQQLRLRRKLRQTDFTLPTRTRLPHPNYAELSLFLTEFHFQDRPYTHGVAHSAGDQAATADISDVGWLSKGLGESVNSPQLHR
jgi:hypothetical protein